MRQRSTPAFAVAPFTGVIVLLISSQLGEGAIESALYRFLEVALGGAVAIVVSLLVLPDRAHRLGLDAAARALDQLASALPKLLAGFARQADPTEIGRHRMRPAAPSLPSKRSRPRRSASAWSISWQNPTSAPLSRTLLRLRHDLVIIGRAAALPLPDVFARRLGPLLDAHRRERRRFHAHECTRARIPALSAGARSV